MLRLKIWILLPLLSLVVPLGGFFSFTVIMVDLAQDGVQARLEHSAAWMGASKQVLCDREGRRTMEAASSLAEEVQFPASMGVKGPQDRKGGVDTTVEDLRAAVRQWLESRSKGGQKAFVAVFGPGGERFAASVDDETLASRCGDSAVLRSAYAGTADSDLSRTGQAVFLVSAAPVRASGVITGVLCRVRQVDDMTAYELQDLTGYDVSIFADSRIIGSTLRQAYPEFVTELNEFKAGFLNQGVLKSRQAPLLRRVAEFMSYKTVLPGRGGQIFVAITTSVEPAVKDFRKMQYMYLLVTLLVFVLALVISWSIHNTFSRSLDIISRGLVSMAKGNLLTQIPTGNLEKPFDTLAESINHMLFNLRDRGGLAAGKKKADLGEVMSTGRSISGVHAAVLRDTVAEQAPAPAPAVPREETSGPAAAARSGSLSGEFQVSEDYEQRVPPPSGELPQQITSRDYNPDATVIAQVPSDLLFDQIDKEMEAARTAKAMEKTGVKDDAVYAAVFSEFLQTRLRCGEKVDNLSQERFVEKLKRTREDVMAKTGCRDVKFNVIIKDNKASIKASPIK